MSRRFGLAHRRVGRLGLAVLVIGFVVACRGGGSPGLAGGAGLGSILAADDEVILTRALPESLGDQAFAVVVKTAGGPVELRIAERPGAAAVAAGGGAAPKRSSGPLAVTHTSRPGDDFRNLTVEDLTGDGRPEIASTWVGGQLEVIEVLGRDAQGAWKPLLQNAGQTVETRRRSDHVAAFWITSRTYEETTGQPPVYQTTVFEWNGTAFAEPGSAGTSAAPGDAPAAPGAEQAVPAMAPRH